MTEQYRKKYTIKLGYLPTRRNVFSAQEAGKFKDIIGRHIAGYDAEIVDIRFLNAEGLLFDGNDADAVADHFIREGVDALFVALCNFGTEDAVAKVARKVGKPVLLWGPRDDAPGPDGIRLRDTQCGLFSTSKALQRFGVPFTYIPNCHVTDAMFDKGFRNFLGVASAVKTFRGMKVGQIDTRPDLFLSVMYNEAELLEKFGIVTRVTSVAALLKPIEQLKKDDKKLAPILDRWKSRYSGMKFSDDVLRTMAAMRIAISDWAEEFGLDALCIQCWDAMQAVLGVYPCFINGDLTDDGLPVACETDVMGAVTSAVLQAAGRGATPAFLADLTVRHPTRDNVELLWHCGNFPASLTEDVPEVEIQFGGKVPAAGRWRLRGGDITIAKIDTLGGKYSMAMGHAKGTDGPAMVGTHIWAEFEDWIKWERRFVTGPYIHHVAAIHGQYAPVLWEFCKYVPGLNPDPIEPEANVLERGFCE